MNCWQQEERLIMCHHTDIWKKINIDYSSPTNHTYTHTYLPRKSGNDIQPSQQQNDSCMQLNFLFDSPVRTCTLTSTLHHFVELGFYVQLRMSRLYAFQFNRNLLPSRDICSCGREKRMQKNPEQQVQQRSPQNLLFTK